VGAKATLKPQLDYGAKEGEGRLLVDFTDVRGKTGVFFSHE